MLLGYRTVQMQSRVGATTTGCGGVGPEVQRDLLRRVPTTSVEDTSVNAQSRRGTCDYGRPTVWKRVNTREANRRRS